MGADHVQSPKSEGATPTSINQTAAWRSEDVAGFWERLEYPGTKTKPWRYSPQRRAMAKYKESID